MVRDASSIKFWACISFPLSLSAFCKISALHGFCRWQGHYFYSSCAPWQVHIVASWGHVN